MACWRLNPKERPDFTGLVKDLHIVLDEVCPDKSKIQGYVPYQESATQEDTNTKVSSRCLAHQNIVAVHHRPYYCLRYHYI